MIPSPAIDRYLQEFLTCLTFYTRMPSGRWISDETDFAEAQWAAPAIGIGIGVFGGFVFWLSTAAAIPAGVTAAITIAVLILLTGALHEDGAADTADGFGGGSTRERKLEIMRDSRIGTFGTLALVMSVLVRWTALSVVSGPALALAALVAAHAASRSLVAPFLMTTPAARSDGLGASAGHASGRTAAFALAIGALSLLAAGPAAALASAFLLALWFFGFRALCVRQIGGQTGDTIGALQQGGEIIVLVIAATAHAT